MSWARDFLARFRPIGTPGAAARAGVPPDRVTEAVAELEPVFAMLANTEAAVERVRSTAEESIAEGHRLAAERAAQLIEQARLRADAERADAAANARAAAAQESARDLVVAQAEAAQIRHLAEEQLDAQIAEILTAVRVRLHALGRQ